MRPPEGIGSFFLDSGAHSLYTKAVLNRGLTKDDKDVFTYYETDEFWKYVDEYAVFLKANKDAIDFYVNVDVIFNPKLTWKVQKYLENEHGLSPLPVIHWATELKWIDKYLNAGYDYIGLGGLGQEATKDLYYGWADKVYSLICPASNGYKPIVKTHGFAMTAYDLLFRYPWYSVDSASWAKAGGFGMIYVPRKFNGQYSFDKNPYTISVSTDAPAVKKAGRSVHNLSEGERKVVKDWLEKIEVPFGSVDEKGDMVEYGVTSHHAPRKIANLKFFAMMCDALPEWPWPFLYGPKKGFFN